MSTVLSYIIPTHNRCDVLHHTLGQIAANTPLPRDSYEVWVVDNASTDGSLRMLARQHAHVRVIALDRNDGACTRQDAVAHVAGDVLAFLDDDSYPMAGTISAALSHFCANARTACVTGPVVLPDGSREASAYPVVPIACGMLVRREAMIATGGFTRAFVRQAEEFDLAFKLLKAGWAVDRIEAARFHHNKPAGARASADVLRLDLRNNLIVLDRHVPEPLRSLLRGDWIQRYTAYASAVGRPEIAEAAIVEADMWKHRDETHTPASDAVLELMFQLEHQRQCVSRWAATQNVRQVILAGFGKNLLATWQACDAANISVLAVADNHPGFKGASYRGVPIMSTSLAAVLPSDGVIVSNINPAQVDAASEHARLQYPGKPVLRLDGVTEEATWHRQSA